MKRRSVPLLVLCVSVGLGRATTAQERGRAVAGAQPHDRVSDEEARRTRRLQAVRAAGKITLDGVLDEPAWAGAPVARDFIQNDPHEGEPATYDTEVRVLYDDDALYFGVFAKDDEPSRVIVNDLKKDFNTASGDGFSIILDTFHDERNGYQFSINPAGAKWDAQMVNEGRENNANWDGIWDVATRIAETGWYAEIKIPFRTLRFSDGEVWGLNFERKLRRLNEDSYWAPLPRIYDLQRVSLAGTLEGMRGLRASKDLRVKPYALRSANTIAGQGSEGEFQGGLDVKYGVTRGLTWDFTVNTDFSQVEADEQQINLSRFSLFFPEKRDFFLENSGIFQFGGGFGGFSNSASGGGGGGGGTSTRQNASQEMRLFFSRRIGLSDTGDAIPILAGTRLTGRQGRYSLGVLNIQQRAQDPASTNAQGRPALATNFTALRLRRDNLANSDIGVVLLDKEEHGSGFNRVAGVDANFRFGFLNLNGHVAKTISPEFITPGHGRDYSTRAAVNYQDRTWQLRGRFDSVGERFDDEMGFVPRQGVNNAFAYMSRTFRPPRLSGWLRESRPHAQFDQFTRQNGGGLESRYWDFHWPLTFQDSSNMEAGVNSNLEEVRSPFTINTSRGVRVNPGRYEFKEYFIFWNTNSAARLSINSRFSIGDFYDGYRRAYTLGPALRLNERFNVALNAQINDITLSTGDFVSTLVTGRVNYNFSTKMFLNALLQFNTDSHQWSSNLRFNIIHRPLSDFFLVYNERRDDRTGDLLNRALVAKLTYLMAF